MRTGCAVVVYGFLLGIPICLLPYLVPTINEAHQRGFSAQDITLFELKDRARDSFQDYRPEAPLAEQRRYLLRRAVIGRGRETKKKGRSPRWKSSFQLLRWGLKL